MNIVGKICQMEKENGMRNIIISYHTITFDSIRLICAIPIIHGVINLFRRPGYVFEGDLLFVSDGASLCLRDFRATYSELLWLFKDFLK